MSATTVIEIPDLLRLTSDDGKPLFIRHESIGAIQEYETDVGTYGAVWVAGLTSPLLVDANSLLELKSFFGHH